jgi:DNA repair protein RecO (recombination protein O)
LSRPRAVRSRRATIATRALLLRRTEHGDTDLVLALFTEREGRVSALARSARRSQKRFGGALEPFHTLAVEMDEPGSGELHHLRSATLETPRLRLTADLARMDAAGRALSWVRAAAPPRIAEPAIWKALTRLLDRLDAEDVPFPRLLLAEGGLSLLSALGWGLDLERCVSCGKPCEAARTALVDAARGGLVCRACGGARLRLSGATRARLAAVQLEPADVDVTLDLVERTLKAHGDVG